MKALVLHRADEDFRLEDVADPKPAPGQVLIRVEACGIFRTDLHIIDGDLKQPKLPRIPCHEFVGRVVRAGADVSGLAPGQRLGVPWLGSTCGFCD